MPMNGVCDLELRQLIEGAFLPARCEVSCSDGLSLTLHFAQDAEHDEMTITGIRLSALPNTRAMADLVAQVREERESLARSKTLCARALTSTGR
ncbi:hypothetical protein DCO48_03665 [Pseudomonas sp. SDI]|uniref:DUF1652 domain-containing protein n=1 Tax=Pseudomonas sp. SDI TaxID=2170734 RepID=UPI000DE6E9D2|nr:DUF1652 domain-containing protein [Pseudomonas sp. SDI]PWB35096.1 hypothetical protein DCO48_03665 [Pseudomonas sp. SDI]